MTQQSVHALHALQNLSDDERFWVLDSSIRGLDPLIKERLLHSFGVARQTTAPNAPPPSYETAKEMLLDDASMSTAEKALIAAFAICDLYELKEFTGRQLTEFLKETGNEINNVTAAMTALVQKGWAEIASKHGENQQSQKRYTLTGAGIARTRMLLQKPNSKRDRADTVESSP